MEDYVTEGMCAERNRDKDGRFYFWRNSFLSALPVIACAIGACYLYVDTRTQLVNERVATSEKMVAVMQRDIDYIRQAVDEQKDTQKEILKELRK